MENDDKNCILIWGQAKYKKTISFNPTSNVPIMHSASLSRTYRAFATNFEAFDASFFRREHVLQIPGLRQLDGQAALDEQEFVVEENVNFNKQSRGCSTRQQNGQNIERHLPSEGAVEEEPDTSTCMGALTFDPSPPLKEDKEF